MLGCEAIPRINRRDFYYANKQLKSLIGNDQFWDLDQKASWLFSEFSNEVCCRIQENNKNKCRFSNYKELTSVFKQFHVILKSTESGVFTAISEYFQPY